MAGRTLALQQPGGGQDQRTGAHRGQIAGIGPQPADLQHEVFIQQCLGATTATRHAQDITVRDVFQRLQTGEVQPLRTDVRTVD
ncbi:hypothetical protein D3C79_900870 [compost metagenome]